MAALDFQKVKCTIQYLVLKLRLLRTQSRPSRTFPTVRPCTVIMNSRKRHLVLAQVHQPVHNIHTLSNLSGKEVMTQALCVVTSYGLVSSYICFGRVSYQHFQGQAVPVRVSVFDFTQSTWFDVTKQYLTL